MLTRTLSVCQYLWEHFMCNLLRFEWARRRCLERGAVTHTVDAPLRSASVHKRRVHCHINFNVIIGDKLRAPCHCFRVTGSCAFSMHPPGFCVLVQAEPE